MYAPPIGTPVKNAPPHHAESADTREEIRRHDPDQQRKKGEHKKEEEPDPFSNNENAFVTIESLAAFLENFLRNLMQENAATTEKQSPSAPPPLSPAMTAPGQPQTQQNRRAQHAASAYQTTARAIDKKEVSFDENIADIPETGLKAREIRAIHRLLNDLKTLSERNIDSLEIERSDSFLHSLTIAAEKALNAS